MSIRDNANSLLRFIQNSPSPFHAVEQCRQRLLSLGFKELVERQNWGSFKPNDKYFFTRNNSSIIAFCVGGNYVPGNGFNIVAAHTDSPCLKLKPISKKSKKGYLQVGVQTYGGGLWHTWFDRDLGIAGRVVADTGEGIKESLIKIDAPILRIPTLAIHLDRTVDQNGFQFNKETHLTPILGLGKPEEDKLSHHSSLLSLISHEAGVKSEDILDVELCLFDVNKPGFCGVNNEFISSARLDNLLMSFCSLEGFIAALPDSKHSDSVWMIALFDNEEVGSDSAYGAGSNLLISSLERISAGLNSTDNFHQSIQKSYLISADCAHAIHPNYSEKHEENHGPEMNKGVVIKLNANQRYATTSVTSAILKKIAKTHGIPLQEFVVKNDSPCGSTIGPILSTSLGMRTIDVGNPQLSMHSIRETSGCDDVTHASGLFKHFYIMFSSLDQ